MTEWSDAGISRRLALAIGWKAEQMEESANGNGVLLPGSGGEMWRTFDYRDPAVIWLIADRFNAFPTLRHGRGWLSRIAPLCPAPGFYADTAAKAVAIAVIKAKEQT